MKTYSLASIAAVSFGMGAAQAQEKETKHRSVVGR